MTQASVSFPGLANVFGGEITVSTGARPSTAILYVGGADVSLSPGDLTFSIDGPAPFTRVFRGAVADAAYMRMNRRVWQVRLQDRRVNWRYSEIDGLYNRWLADGTIDAGTEKNPIQLATLLLDALGESGYDVSALPTQARPHVDWQSANAGDELQKLCHSLGCVIGFDTTDNVVISRVGVGATLPFGGTQKIPGRQLNSRPTPNLKFVAPAWVQSKLSLKAVGLDTDGTIKAIDDLSYTPTNGWTEESFHFFPNVAAAARPLAASTVFRWYQVTGQASGGLAVPGVNVVINDISQYLPLSDKLLQYSTDEQGVKEPLNAYVEGQFWAMESGPFNTAAGTRYDGRFTIDKERGIVVFEEPVVSINSANNFVAPTIYLTTSYQVRNPLDRHPHEFEAERNLGGNLTRLLREDGAIATIRWTYNGTSLLQRFDNFAFLSLIAGDHLDAAERDYTSLPMREIEYAGILALPVDGKIRQLKYQVGRGRASSTRASENFEFDIYS